MKAGTVSDRTPEQFAIVQSVLIEQLGVPVAQLVPEANLEADLGADSLDLVELIMSMEDEFGLEISDEDAEGILTVQDAINYILERKK